MADTGTFKVIWYTWTATSTAASTSTCDSTWTEWCETSATCNTSTATWGQWNSCTVTTNRSQYVPRELTPQEVAARESAQKVERERQEKYRAEKAAAEKRATELFRTFLDAQQREQVDKERKFHVIGSDGVRYEVDVTKRQHNVFELDSLGRRIKEFCIYQTGDTPLPDNHLAQKLLLEADAQQFRRIANARALAA